ncbi:MAG: cob(I)yrinic acid a,c-diamide adenosyltransferase [Patescibacteria group bacterium]
MSITTKKGDRGETDLYDGRRVRKSDSRIAALATIDELNSHMGLAISLGGDEFLEVIQNDLFVLGSIIANPKSKENMTENLTILEDRATELEATIPPLKNFILPAGETLACQIHIARSVCRRAETQLAKDLDVSCCAYINRLSDYLFLLARSVNIRSKKKEVIWKKL